MDDVMQIKVELRLVYSKLWIKPKEHWT